MMRPGALAEFPIPAPVRLASIPEFLDNEDLLAPETPQALEGGQIPGDFHLFEPGAEALVGVELPEPPADNLETFGFEDAVEVGSKVWDGREWHYRGPDFMGTVVQPPRPLAEGQVYVLPHKAPPKKPMVLTRRYRRTLIVDRNDDGIDPHPSVIDRQPQLVQTSADSKLLACRVISRRVLPQTEVLFNL